MVTSKDTADSFSPRIDSRRVAYYHAIVVTHTIRLVACIGTQSNPFLVSHFMHHYRALGVGEFLIVLHSDRADRRDAEVRARLHACGIQPAREIQQYSARLKHQHCQEVVRHYCEPDSWVIYADLDELQVYPGGLIPYLDERERRGHSFARGSLIDRLAPNGELIELQAQPSLWEQFPICAPVTREIVGGWDHKVCAARACVPIVDGGSHSVSYGYGAQWNYWLTHVRPRWRERRVEIHHFKWDSTLPHRVRNKLEGAGGDLDRWHGSEFMDEYRRLDEHLRRHGRIRTRAD